MWTQPTEIIYHYELVNTRRTGNNSRTLPTTSYNLTGVNNKMNEKDVLNMYPGLMTYRGECQEFFLVYRIQVMEPDLSRPILIYSDCSHQYELQSWNL